ncbi:TonB family protein [Pseudophaeobacter leonis]|uniref:TonB family protein n=1 Tax=Pseudophaeobacter leonis TaxID=1144477 RepID=UPI0009F40E11|nr:TonB family protein [Pseudophaeobacter leonis]
MSVQIAPPALEVPQSLLAGILALALALGLHAAFALQNQTSPVEQAGGNTALAAQGSSFANMAAGVETPQQAEVAPAVQELPKVQPVQPMPPIQPVQTPQVTVAKPTPVQRPEPVELVKPVTPIQAVAGGVPLVLSQTKPEPVVAKPPELTAVEVSAEVLEGVTPVIEQALDPSVTKDAAPAPEPLPTPPAAQAADPVQTQQPVAIQKPLATPEPEMAADPVAATQPVEANVQPPEPQSPPVTESLRPPERPKPEVVRRTDPKPAPKSAQKTSAKPRGNGNVNATRGVASSTRSQPGGQAQTTGGSAKVQGNAAASNYAGLVMRRIQRAKRRADVRGEALVRFSITSGGGVASVSLARSSGSGKLDGIALAQVRRAAPFPPPPPGARTSFTVRIKGK